MHLFKRLLVLVVLDLPRLLVPPGEDALLPAFVELPLLHVLRDVLLVRAEGIPDAHASVVAVEAVEGDVEVDAQGLVEMGVHGDRGGDVGR